jgi:hypothetical protein
VAPFGVPEVEVEVEVEETSSPSLSQKAKLGLEPRFRNRFGALLELGQLSLPSSLSRRSAQLKATNSKALTTSIYIETTLLASSQDAHVCGA